MSRFRRPSVLSTAMLLVLAAGFAAPAASAAPCRDGKGKFITCPPPAKKTACRDASGKFIKCNAMTPGTMSAGH